MLSRIPLWPSCSHISSHIPTSHNEEFKRPRGLVCRKPKPFLLGDDPSIQEPRHSLLRWSQTYLPKLHSPLTPPSFSQERTVSPVYMLRGLRSSQLWGGGQVVGAVDMGFRHIARGWGEVCTHTHKPHGARVEREGSHIADWAPVSQVFPHYGILNLNLIFQVVLKIYLLRWEIH